MTCSSCICQAKGIAMKKILIGLSLCFFYFSYANNQEICNDPFSEEGSSYPLSTPSENDRQLLKEILAEQLVDSFSED